MTKVQQRNGACRRSTPSDRRHSPKTGLVLVFWGLWIMIIFSTATRAVAGDQVAAPQKGITTMQQAATVSVNEVPPLDKSQPSRMETFTFGLG